MLKWISGHYNSPEILITENGYSDVAGLNDVPRAKYHMDVLNGVLDAMEEGVKVVGYTAWSLMDSFEWPAGYTANFGLYHVDFNSSARTRTPKLSAEVYARICKLNRINFDYSDLRAEFAAKSHAVATTAALAGLGGVTSFLCVVLGSLRVHALIS